MVSTFQAAIASRTTVAEGTVEIAFDAHLVPLSFKAGQYITVTMPGLAHVSPREQFRDFSIASSPSHPERITTTFRISDSPFKQALLSAPIGTEVTIEGPKGVFTMPEASEQPVAWIAGGVGITPFMSMVREAMETGATRPVDLFYNNTEPARTAYLDELVAFAKRFPQVRLHAAYGPLAESSMQDWLAKNPSGDMRWYIAGPPGMVAAARSILWQEGIEHETIFTEEFSGYADLA